MLPQRMKTAITDNPKKLANLIDLVNLPSTLREFVGQSQISRLGCFKSRTPSPSPSSNSDSYCSTRGSQKECDL
ncbi:hypothetical protein SDJN02_03189 [Cucurbita argyrosperma subsp. argyrosperma]|nr:hypothetical protein SDJN02_03189 [Cucurbita argyrosperma subsp. argyrosperma]